MRGVPDYGARIRQERGAVATQDMKRRIEALRAEGIDIVAALWERFEDATVREEGFRYEYADAPEVGTGTHRPGLGDADRVDPRLAAERADSRPARAAVCARPVLAGHHPDRDGSAVNVAGVRAAGRR